MRKQPARRKRCLERMVTASQSARNLQRGEFLMTRALLIVAILMAMLVVPIYLSRDKSDKQAKLDKREAASAKPVQTTAVPAQPAQATPSAPAREIGYGLSFAYANDAKQPPNTAHIGCHGDPVPQDRPHKGSCNPYQGDTSCRTVLPVLCLKPGSEPQPPGSDAGFYKGWTGGVLGASQPVMGAILTSEAAGTARCEAEFGTGWRMAEFHDGQGGWGLQGVRGGGLAANNRYWVHVNDQPGNCWNSKP